MRRHCLGQDRSAGFAVVEGVLIVLIIAAIVGVGAFVMHQKNKADSTLSSTTTSATTLSTPAGTSSSIDKLTIQEAQAETGIDNSTDTNLQQSASSDDASVNTLEGANDEERL